MISILAAITKNHAIGKNGDMLYHISADLQRFKSLTLGHPVIMGRKTFETLPKGPLPNRRNLVVTRTKSYMRQGIETFNSLEQALQATHEDCFVIGGGQIYSKAIDLADRLEITLIDAEASDADTFFPDINRLKWHLESKSEQMVDPCSGIKFAYLSYARNFCDN